MGICGKILVSMVCKLLSQHTLQSMCLTGEGGPRRKEAALYFGNKSRCYGTGHNSSSVILRLRLPSAV